MMKCGVDSVNWMTRQRTDQGLHVVHSLRDNIPDTLSKTYQPRENKSYTTGATQAARKSIKDTWEHNQFEFVTRNNCQHTIKNKIISAVSPELLEEKKKRRKGFASVLGHEFMEYLMLQYRNNTEIIKEQAKYEFRKYYYPSLPISEFFIRIEDAVQLMDNAKFPWQPEEILQ